MAGQFSTAQIEWTRSFTGVPIAPAEADAPGGGAAPGPIGGLVNTIGDIKKKLTEGKKTAEELTNPKTPTFPDDHLDTNSPRTRFLDDMKTGTAKAKAYIGYMNTVAEQAAKYGKSIEGIGKAASELAKITGKLKGGLGKVGGAFEKAKQFSAWLDALENFADDCNAMDPKDGDSVQKWSDSFQHLWNASAPFIDWLKDRATAVALAEGSAAAATLGVMLTAVSVEVIAAGKVLSAGIANVNAYFKRMHELDEASQRDAQGGAVPADPELPEPWEDADERDEKERQQAEFHKKEQEHAREQQAADAKREQHQKLVEQFEKGPFIKIYRDNRKDIMDQVRAAITAAGKSDDANEASVDDPWWDCFMLDDAGGEDTTPDNPEAPALSESRKASANDKDAAREIELFRAVRPPCPFFDKLYQAELKKFLAHASKGQHAGAHH
jgi:hypothetical protein